jgi:hypothetical protein
LFFDDNYALMPLSELESYLKEKKHLPKFPSEKEITEKSVDIGKLLYLQQQQIEELTLYVIELNKQIQQLQEK